MAVNVGRGTIIGIKAESTYGTAVTPDVFLRTTSVNLNRKQMIEPSPELSGAVGSLEARYRLEEQIEAGGSIEMLAMYEGAGVLWQHLMRDTVATTGSGPYAHVLDLGVARSSLTVEVVRGTSFGGTGYAETFEGSVVSSWTLAWTLNQPARLSMEVISETTTGPDDTPTSATYTANHQPMLFHHVTMVWNSVTYKMRSLRIGVRHNVDRLYVLGSKLTEEPVITAPPEVFIEAEILAETWTAISGQQAATSATATVTCTNGTQSLSAVLRQVAWDEATVSHSDNGPQYIQVRGRALGSGSSSSPGLSVTITNSQSTFTAA